MPDADADRFTRIYRDNYYRVLGFALRRILGERSSTSGPAACWPSRRSWSRAGRPPWPRPLSWGHLMLLEATRVGSLDERP